MYIYIYNYIIRFLSGAIMDISRLTNHFVVNFSPSSRWIPKGSTRWHWFGSRKKVTHLFTLSWPLLQAHLYLCVRVRVYICICFWSTVVVVFFGSQRGAILIFALFNKQLITSRSQFVTHFASSCSKYVNVTSQNPQHPLPPHCHSPLFHFFRPFSSHCPRCICAAA